MKNDATDVGHRVVLLPQINRAEKLRTKRTCVVLRLTMRAELKHTMQLSDISRGICSLILGAMGHYQTAETSLLLHMSAAWPLAVI